MLVGGEHPVLPFGEPGDYAIFRIVNPIFSLVGDPVGGPQIG